MNKSSDPDAEFDVERAFDLRRFGEYFRRLGFATQVKFEFPINAQSLDFSRDSRFLDSVGSLRKGSNLAIVIVAPSSGRDSDGSVRCETATLKTSDLLNWVDKALKPDVRLNKLYFYQSSCFAEKSKISLQNYLRRPQKFPRFDRGYGVFACAADGKISNGELVIKTDEGVSGGGYFQIALTQALEESDSSWTHKRHYERAAEIQKAKYEGVIAEMLGWQGPRAVEMLPYGAIAPCLSTFFWPEGAENEPLIAR
jgi:hypothetical protein